jgi:hypothetical protein
MPISFPNLLCRSDPRAFVNPSATMSSVGQYSSYTVPSSTQFLIIWYWMSMCFVRAWCSGL